MASAGRSFHRTCEVRTDPELVGRVPVTVSLELLDKEADQHSDGTKECDCKTVPEASGAG